MTETFNYNPTIAERLEELVDRWEDEARQARYGADDEESGTTLDHLIRTAIADAKAEVWEACANAVYALLTAEKHEQA